MVVNKVEIGRRNVELIDCKFLDTVGSIKKL